MTNLILRKGRLNPPKTRVQLPTWRGHWKRSHTQSSPYGPQLYFVHVRVWVHILGECWAEEGYDKCWTPSNSVTCAILLISSSLNLHFPKGRLFCMALVFLFVWAVRRVGGMCSIYCQMELALAFMHLYSIFNLQLFLSIPFYDFF